MIKALIRKLGLDRLGEVLAEEVRRAEREILAEERAALASMITKLDERIAGLGGKRRGRPPNAAIAAAPPPATRKPRRKKARITPKPGETLKDFVLKALAEAVGPLKVPTLVDLVLEAGYKTTAKRTTLVTSTYTVLTDKKLFRKMGKGVFALAVAPATRQRAPRRRKKAAEKKSPAKEPGPMAIASKPGETLQYFILLAFRKSGGPVKPRHLVESVKQLGYRTTSTPETLVYSVERILEDEKLFKQAGRGLYELALPGSTKGKVGRPKKPTATKAPPAVAKEEKAESTEQPEVVEQRGT